MAAGTSVKQPVVKLRPSDAHRWLVCRAAPGYCARLEAEGRLPKQEFEYTLEGQRAHVLAAKLLLGQALPKDAEKEMVQHVQAYAEFVRKIAAKHPGCVLMVERKVPVHYSDRHGYVDAAVVVFKGDKLVAVYVVDLKYGRGVSVKADRNPQLGIYVKSLLVELADLYEIDRKTPVSITIWQPRVQGEKTERTWATHVGDVDNLNVWITEVAKDIQARPFDQKFEPSEDACQFCPAAPLCEARARDLLGGADEVLDVVVLDRQPGETQEVTPPLPATLSPEQLARVMAVAPVLRKWLTKVEEFALAGMEQGKLALPGHKLVRGRPGNRKWTDKDKAEVLLRRMFPKDVVTPPELISPAAAEVLMKERNARQKMWDEFEALVARAEGNLVLAPLDDERAAVDPRLEAAEHFDEEGSELL
jgi:hypothetical protein